MDNPINNRFSRIQPIFDYLKKQQENEKFLKTLEIAATFVLIIFFIFFAIKPTALTISTLLGDIESKKILKSQLSQKINNVIMAQDLYAQVEGKYSAIENSLPDRPHFFDSANQIQNIGGSGSGLGVLAFNLDQTVDASSITNTKKYSISLSSKGSFLSAVEMASRLLQNQKLANITSIQFATMPASAIEASPSANSNQKGIGSNFNVTFYYWPNKK